jgi:hypothetical protein
MQIAVLDFQGFIAATSMTTGETLSPRSHVGQRQAIEIANKRNWSGRVDLNPTDRKEVEK